MPTTRDDDDESDRIAGDWDDDFENDSVPCSHCRRDIPEDAIRCPYCENYLSDIDSPPARHPLWFIIGFLLALFVVLRWGIPR